VLLLTAGSVHRIGPNRLYTVLARRWAARGDLVLRFDIAGIGDSPARSGLDENVVYSPDALADVAAAIAWAREQPGIREVCAVGLCSGAYHAFKAAVAGQLLDTAIAINPLTFFWEPGAPLDVRAHDLARETDRYLRSALDLEKWKKLFRNELDMRVLAKNVLLKIGTIAVNQARDLSRRIGFPWSKDLGAELEMVAKRRVALHFVFASGDPGRILLREQGGSVVPRLLASGELHVALVQGPDHTFTQLWSHELLARALDEALDGIGRRQAA
jgi:hypothetical protein